MEVRDMVSELILGILELFSCNFMYGYLTGLNSFPKPLTKEEESEYLIRYKDGDEQARNILIERNLRLVAHIVKKYTQSSRDSDDLISIGTIGLIKAITNFDYTKGVRLATYAIRCIENAMLSLRLIVSKRYSQ
jgi:RNA polymerase sporulation-specific sigma factor